MSILIKTSIKSLRLFLVALILCTLAACGGGNDGTPSGASATVAPTTAQTASPTDAKLNSPVDEQGGTAPAGKMEIGKIYCVKCSSCHVPETKNLSFCPHRTN